MPKLTLRPSLVATLLLLALIAATFAAPTAAQEQETLTVYSGRSESLMAPLFEQFTADTGIALEVRYGSTSEMAATILEEGANSPADVFIGQDAGALGALAAEGRLRKLPGDILGVVPPQFESPDGVWVGLSGRVRILVYNKNTVKAEELPASLLDLTGPQWKGRVGWAPSNGSFQANVTAMRVLLGEEATKAWLEGMVANEVKVYEGNNPILTDVAAGTIDVGLINHYYVWALRAQQPDAPVEIHFFPQGDPGALINIAGAGIINTSQKPGLAQRFMLYMLGRPAQTYFSEQTYEYPLAAGIAPQPGLTPLDQIEAPEIDLSALADLRGTLDLLRSTNVLP